MIGLLSGCLVLQYADVRAAYPTALTGRALAVFTMSMFLGVAAMPARAQQVVFAAQGFPTGTLAAGRYETPGGIVQLRVAGGQGMISFNAGSAFTILRATRMRFSS